MKELDDTLLPDPGDYSDEVGKLYPEFSGELKSSDEDCRVNQKLRWGIIERVVNAVCIVTVTVSIVIMLIRGN
jgi:hypothetical protein